MPPRLTSLPLRLATVAAPAQHNAITPFSFLLPLLQGSVRHASILADLSDNRSAYNKLIRRGRGPASGKGKTSGRGHGGQKQHGKVPVGFNGGQTKDEVVSGTRGEEGENIFTAEMSPVNLDRIQDWIDQGRIDPKLPITVREIVKSRCIHGVKDGVKLLGRGGLNTLKQPVNIVVSRASASAIAAVEAAGGTVVTRYYTKFAIKRIMQGKTDPFVSRNWDESEYGNLAPGMGVDAPRVKGEGFQYRLPDPTSRKDLEYYRDPAHRGYLSHLVKEGESPSLFFKAPSAKIKRTKVKKVVSENMLW